MENTRKFAKLVADTEELLDQISDQDGAEVKALRDRLERSLEQTKALLAEQHEAPPFKVRHVAASVNDYVRDYPWIALATGVLVASTIGILATSAQRRSFDAQNDHQHA
jgi:ElaB/YqjD/DUF883 family membrane-anchored ribosome-binding protein